MSENNDFDFLINVSINTDNAVQKLNDLLSKTEIVSNKIGQTLSNNKVSLNIPKQLIKQDSTVKQAPLQKDSFIDTNFKKESLNKETIKSNEKEQDSVDKTVNKNSNIIKKGIKSVETFSTMSFSKLKKFFKNTEEETEKTANNMSFSLSKLAKIGVGALGITSLLNLVKNTIAQNADLGYKSEGLNVSTKKMSAFEQGAEQVGIDKKTSQSIFYTIAQMQANQYSPDAEISANNISHLTRINTLLGTSNKTKDGKDKDTSQYLADIISSVQTKNMPKMQQEAMLQKALGVDLITANQLLAKKLPKKIKQAEQFTAITDQQAQEAIFVKNAKNTLSNLFKKGTSNVIDAFAHPSKILDMDKKGIVDSYNNIKHVFTPSHTNNHNNSNQNHTNNINQTFHAV